MHVLPCFGQKSGLAPDPLPATQIPGPEIKLLTQPLVQVVQHLRQEGGRRPKLLLHGAPPWPSTSVFLWTVGEHLSI